MGVLPLQFRDGENAQTLGLKGEEMFDIVGLKDGTAQEVDIVAQGRRRRKEVQRRRSCC